jgi:hypothetical protein
MTRVWTKSKGMLVYNPCRPDLRKIRRAEEWLLMVKVDPGISLYYRWWIKKRWGIHLHPPMFDTHITVLDGRVPVKPIFKDKWGSHKYELIEFEYSVEFEQHWKFFVLPVKCDRLNDIRSELGFASYDDFHITFGRVE